jgi:hypothetical protein
MSALPRASDPLPSPHPNPARGGLELRDIETAPVYELRLDGVTTDATLRKQLLGGLRSGVARLSAPLQRVVLDIAVLRPGQPLGGPLQCRVTVTLRNSAPLLAYAIDRDPARGATRAMERLHTKMNDAARGGPR